MKVCSVVGCFSDAMQGNSVLNNHQTGEATGSGSSGYFDPSHENYTQPAYPFTFV